MPPDAPIYDLFLLLSTSAPEEERAKILTDVESAISAGGGSIERNQDWGTRAMTYPINHQGDAEYRLLQFSGPPSLLESLSHTLRIADEVVRFRIIKLIPGMPPAPDVAPPTIAGAPASAGSTPAAAPAVGAPAATVAAESRGAEAAEAPAVAVAAEAGADPEE